MKNIVCISDLHFGMVDKKIAEDIVDDSNNLVPDPLVVGGILLSEPKRTGKGSNGYYQQGKRRTECILFHQG